MKEKPSSLREAVKKQDDWSYWPFLPVKNRQQRTASGLHKTGVIISNGDDDFPPEVALGNIWDTKNLLTAPKVEYPTWEAMEEAGWEID